jgi:uncharacterized tellurite resistance protein B-like protein
MLDIVKRFFDKTAPGRSGAGEGAAEHDLRVATCALLVEMARIDETFSASEMETILSILKDQYGLSPEDAEALIAEADRELADSVDYWRFARLINENYTNEEKIGIIETLWRIVFIDGKMDKHEDYLIHKLADLLRLTHQQLIDAKLKVRDKG